MKRIKTLSQKLQSGSFSSPIPLGVDSIYTDMFSGSNLEQEMHLGSPSITAFDTDDDNNTIIIEEYKNDEQQTNKYYKMITTFITTDDSMSIVQKLYYIEEDLTETLQKTKTINFSTVNDKLQIREVIE